MRQFIADNSPLVSAVSYVEVLGLHHLTVEDKTHFEKFFAAYTVSPLTQFVLDQAVQLQQTRKKSLGDSVLAATCLIHNLALVTRDIDDFSWIVGLGLLNPSDLPKQQADS